MALEFQNYDPATRYGAVRSESKLAVTQGSVIVGDSGGLGSELVASGSAKLLVGDGTTIASVAMSGDATISSAGVVAVTNIVPETEVVTASTEAILVADSGKIYFNNAGSATQTYTLPAVAAGLTYTFILTNAGGEILIDQAASEVITITTFAAVGADADTAIVAPSGGTGIKGTAATNAVGDSLTLVSDGTGWYGVGITSGIWASQ